MASLDSTDRCWNFAAGPAALPYDVLRQAREGLMNWGGTGLSVLELPFTGSEFRAIQEEAEAGLRDLAGIPADYRVLFLQGGAYGHFGLVPLNLLPSGGSADYAVTGHWSRRALGEGERFGRARAAVSTEDSGYTRLPDPNDWEQDPEAAYCHLTTAETANGVQFPQLPDTGRVPLVADMTADLLTRRPEVERCGLIYASAQKNLGAAGLTLVIAHRDLLSPPDRPVPAVFDYEHQARGDSRINTPPTFAVYLLNLILRWIREQGGLDAMELRSRSKSTRVYRAIEESGGFYRCPVRAPGRSRVNICFRLPSRSLEERFLAEAEGRGLRNLRGHPSVGGIRVSLYNAVPAEAAEDMAAFMEEFAERHLGVSGNGGVSSRVGR